MSLDGLQLGHYLLLHLIGSGGMGEVYLAEDMRIHRQVAIKIVRAEKVLYPDANATKEATRLFQREMRAIISLDHQHILPLYDFGEEMVNKAILTYMVMPYRKEGSLADWLQQRGSSVLLSPQDVGYFLQQAASALQHAHNRQIIHQDVKPSNFLIHSNEEQPDRPDLLLADFGVAKFTSATSDTSHAIRGTPTYMAPEQWNGEPLPATDQYALAIMAYELLTGRPPFQGPPLRMMNLHATMPPQPPSMFNSRIPGTLDAVLLRALAKKPEDRFPTISLFAQAFQQASQSADTPDLVNTLTSPDQDIRATLAISKDEAARGTTRTLTLPGGQHVTVAIPAGAEDGQIIRLQGQDDPTGGTRSPGALILTITILETEKPIPSLTTNSDQTATSSATFSNTGGAAASMATSEPTVVKEAVFPPQVDEAVVSLAGFTRDGQVTASRRSPSRKKTILLLGLALLIIGLSAGLFSIGRSNLLLGNNPATATTTIIQNPYIAGGTLALNDSFNSNPGKGYNPYQWEDDKTPTNLVTQGRCQIRYGGYDMQSEGPNYCVASALTFSNFAYQIQMTIVHGNEGGIVFRINGADQLYYFYISSKGMYALDIARANGLYQPLSTGSSSAIKQGLQQSNLIAVVVNGNTIAMYVNLHKIAQALDATYSSGFIGVAVALSSESNLTEVVYHDAKVWTI